MIKKLISAVLVAFAVTVGASAAQTIFPVSRTDMDGVTRSGYMDENGQTVLPFAYTRAGEFASCGLAAVEDEKWQTAVINREGEIVVPYTDSPVSVDFSDDMVAYRYAGCSVYYTVAGRKVGSYPGAEGFFSDGLLLCKNTETGLYFYVNEAGDPAFSGEFKEAGAFAEGRALVRTTKGVYTAIDTKGQTLYTLESSVTPAYMTIFGQDTVVLSNGTNQALYSLARGAYLTEFLYNAISEFQDGVAMVRQINRWGLIDLSGRLLIKPSYYYLSYMGEGLYAARGEDGSCAAVDASGNIAYRTTTYVGGFNELRYGLSWHGLSDGSLIFFRKNGGYFASLKNAENPTLLSENVVRVRQDGTTKYVNLSTDKTLFAQPVSFDLGGGVTANTVHYEKFIGYQADGSEHGWDVYFPEISGLPDAGAQKNINAAIRDFFLKGPSVTAEYEALEGGYGVSVEGSVLVVWANCVSGKGTGSSVWNNSLAFDMHTGHQYQIGDLMKNGYIEQVKALLPEDHAIYLYSFPRMSTEGITYYYNEYESDTRRAYTESFLIPFSALDVLDTEGACYQALHTPYSRTASLTGFSDVPNSHWAVEYIRAVEERGLMHGAHGAFRPNDRITGAEVSATIARGQKLQKPAALMQGIRADAWYAEEVSAAHAAGLLDGLKDFRPDAPMTRADAMQVFANLLLSRGKTLPDAKTVETTLSAFTDGAQVPAERRAAAALCIREGMIQGSGGKINAQGYFTRAEFAKLLSMI